MSSSTRNTVLGFVLLVAIAAGGWYVVTRGGHLPQSTPEAKAPTEAAKEEAVALLPDPRGVEEVQEIADGIYWVHQRLSDGGGASPKERDRSWVMHLKTKSAMLIEELEFGDPGAAVSTTQSDRYFTVSWDWGWEGAVFSQQDVIDRSNGALVLRLISRDSRHLFVERGGERLDVQLAPENGCAAANGEAEVTGLLVNGEAIPLSAPQKVKCVVNDMTGDSLYPPFSAFSFAESDHTIRVDLPWGTNFTVPVERLNIEEAHPIGIFNWIGCRSSELGFEMKTPLEWGKCRVSLGAGPIDDLGYWQYRIGHAFWSNRDIHLTLMVRKTDLSMQDLNSLLRHDFGENPEEVTINGFPAFRNTHALHLTSSNYQYRDFLMIKWGDLYYFFDFSIVTDDEKNVMAIVEQWEDVIKNFKPLP